MTSIKIHVSFETSCFLPFFFSLLVQKSGMCSKPRSTELNPLKQARTLSAAVAPHELVVGSPGPIFSSISIFSAK